MSLTIDCSRGDEVGLNFHFPQSLKEKGRRAALDSIRVNQPSEGSGSARTREIFCREGVVRTESTALPFADDSSTAAGTQRRSANKRNESDPISSCGNITTDVGRISFDDDYARGVGESRLHHFGRVDATCPRHHSSNVGTRS